MSSIPNTPAPRLLLFPQVGSADGREGRPTVRRYSLTRLPGAHRPSRPARPAAKPVRI